MAHKLKVDFGQVFDCMLGPSIFHIAEFPRYPGVDLFIRYRNFQNWALVYLLACYVVPLVYVLLFVTFVVMYLFIKKLQLHRQLDLLLQHTILRAGPVETSTTKNIERHMVSVGDPISILYDIGYTVSTQNSLTLI